MSEGTGDVAGFTLAVAHVLERQRGRFGAVLVTVALLGVVIGSLLERARGAATAPTETLLGPVFGLALPLLTFSIVRRVTSDSKLTELIDACAVHGASRRIVALGLIFGVALCAVVSSVGLSSVALLITHGLGDRALPSDLVTTTWIAALGALAYSCLFLSGAGLGRRGIGAVVLLAADWLLGSSTTFAALPWPRAHLFNLVGGPPLLDLAAWQASAILAGLCVLYGALLPLRFSR